jgi:hypothetical protein
MRGKKGDYHPDPDDPPRCRANKQRGHGTYDNDRPPVVGTVGRESGQVRLRVLHHTDQETLEQHVHAFTLAGVQVYTDEWLGYLIRPFATANTNGHVMMTEMASVKYTSTPPKACGPRCAISSALFAACIKNISAATSPFVSLVSI